MHWPTLKSVIPAVFIAAAVAAEPAIAQSLFGSGRNSYNGPSGFVLGFIRVMMMGAG